MRVLKEEFKVTSISIYEDFPDFPTQFFEYISIFRITCCIDFEIQLKDEYLNSKAVKKEIKDYITKKYKNLKVTFTESQLPF
jgi:hypothetical protein